MFACGVVESYTSVFYSSLKAEQIGRWMKAKCKDNATVKIRHE